MHLMTVFSLGMRLVDTNFLQVHTKRPVGGDRQFLHSRGKSEDRSEFGMSYPSLFLLLLWNKKPVCPPGQGRKNACVFMSASWKSLLVLRAA